MNSQARFEPVRVPTMTSNRVIRFWLLVILAAGLGYDLGTSTGTGTTFAINLAALVCVYGGVVLLLKALLPDPRGRKPCDCSDRGGKVL